MAYNGFLYDQFSRPAYRTAEYSRFTKHLPSSSRPTAEELKCGTLKVLRARSRYITRNFAHAGGVIRWIARRVAGAGLRIQPRMRASGSGLLLREENAQLERIIDQWWRDGITPTGLKWKQYWTLSVIQFLVDGEVFRRKIENPRRKGISREYQVLRGDQLAENEGDEALCEFAEGNSFYLGIESDPLGRRVAYHFYKNGRTSYGSACAEPLEIERVPADQIIAWQNLEMPDSARGIPILTPVVLRLADFDELLSALLTTMWNQAGRSMIVETPFPVETMEARVGALNTAGANPDSCTGSDRVDRMLEDMPIGETMYMLPGEKVQFGEPKAPGDNFTAGEAAILRALAAGIGCSYEELAKQWSGVNSSNGRLISEGDKMLLREFFEDMDEGLIEGMYADIVDHVFDLNRVMPEPKCDDRHAMLVQHPQPGPADPLKQALADEQMIQSRTTSPQRICASRGEDAYEVIDEIAEFENYMREKGVEAGGAKVAGNQGNAQRQIQGDDPNAADDSAAAANIVQIASKMAINEALQEAVSGNS